MLRTATRTSFATVGLSLLLGVWLGLHTTPVLAQDTGAPGGETTVTDTLPADLAPVEDGSALPATPSDEEPVSTDVSVTSSQPITVSLTTTTVVDGQPDITDQLILISLLALGFGLVALALVLDYIYRIQQRYYTVAEHLAQSGKAVQVKEIGALERPAGAELEVAMGDEGQPQAPPSLPPLPTLTVEGPGLVTVGKESTEFTATLEPEAEDVEVTWAVEPVDAAAVQPLKGRRVKVIAATGGAFRLTATAVRSADGASGSETVSVAAVKVQPAGVELPFVGRGYGSIAIAIVVLTVVVVLGLAGVLDGQAVATVLGGLVGYVFGSGVASRNAGGAKGNEEE